MDLIYEINCSTVQLCFLTALYLGGNGSELGNVGHSLRPRQSCCGKSKRQDRTSRVGTLGGLNWQRPSTSILAEIPWTSSLETWCSPSLSTLPPQASSSLLPAMDPSSMHGASVTPRSSAGMSDDDRSPTTSTPNFSMNKTNAQRTHGLKTDRPKYTRLLQSSFRLGSLIKPHPI